MDQQAENTPPNSTVEDLTPADMKTVELKPNTSKFRKLILVSEIALEKLLIYQRLIATGNTGEVIDPALPLLPDTPSGQLEPPDNIRQRILELGGRDTKLVLENRYVFQTDVEPNNNRLAIPQRKIRDLNFLEEDEKRRLEARENIDVELIVDKLEDVVTTCKLAKWNMPKPSGRVNSVYVLKGRWYKDVVSKISLVKNDIIDLWSFRVNGAIRFALVVRE